MKTTRTPADLNDLMSEFYKNIQESVEDTYEKDLMQLYIASLRKSSRQITYNCSFGSTKKLR